MHLQRQPNHWSCVPTAFAMALNVRVSEFIAHIGHDGSQIIWPTLKEPHCRRGFHVQECIDIAFRAGFSVTPIEAIPSHAPAEPVPAFEIVCGGSEKTALERFARIVLHHRGVLTGYSHAVAFDHGVICDPCGHVYHYHESERRGFIGICAWIIERTP
jgi:hypothetical protein